MDGRKISKTLSVCLRFRVDALVEVGVLGMLNNWHEECGQSRWGIGAGCLCGARRSVFSLGSVSSIFDGRCREESVAMIQVERYYHAFTDQLDRSHTEPCSVTILNSMNVSTLDLLGDTPRHSDEFGTSG